MIKEGAIFTGKWFKGKIKVLEVKEDTNELEVCLQSSADATEDDYHWYETWNLQHTRIGIRNGDYFNIPLTQN